MAERKRKGPWGAGALTNGVANAGATKVALMAWGHAMAQRYVKEQAGQETAKNTAAETSKTAFSHSGGLKMAPEYLKNLELEVNLGGACKLCYAYDPRYGADLGVHVTLNHLPRRRGVLFCKWCDRGEETFATEGALLRHAAEIHTGKTVRRPPLTKPEHPLGVLPHSPIEGDVEEGRRHAGSREYADDVKEFLVLNADAAARVIRRAYKYGIVCGPPEYPAGVEKTTVIAEWVRTLMQDTFLEACFPLTEVEMARLAIMLQPNGEITGIVARALSRVRGEIQGALPLNEDGTGGEGPPAPGPPPPLEREEDWPP